MGLALQRAIKKTLKGSLLVGAVLDPDLRVLLIRGHEDKVLLVLRRRQLDEEGLVFFFIQQLIVVLGPSQAVLVHVLGPSLVIKF